MDLNCRKNNRSTRRFSKRSFQGDEMTLMKKLDLSAPPRDLREFRDKRDRWVLVLDGQMSPASIKRLFTEHRNSESSGLIMDLIAEHPNTPTDLLKILSMSSEWSILHALASNPRITDEVIDRLVESGDYSILENLVKNPTTPSDRLRLLHSRTKDMDLKRLIEDVITKRETRAAAKNK